MSVTRPAVFLSFSLYEMLFNFEEIAPVVLELCNIKDRNYVIVM